MDDGAYLVCKILIKMARLKNDSNGKLSDLISDLDSPCESKEYRMKIKFNDFKEYGSNILDNLKDYVKSINGWGIEPENYEGIKVNCNKENGDGWVFIKVVIA